jgi:hypothetical protein
MGGIMKISIDFLYLFMAAFGAIGVIEYIKGFFPLAPKWVWRVCLPPVCLGVALAGDGGWFQIGTTAILLLALTQICYDLIISSVKKLLLKKMEQ